MICLVVVIILRLRDSFQSILDHMQQERCVKQWVLTILYGRDHLHRESYISLPFQRQINVIHLSVRAAMTTV